jgi:hypothetical protein
MGDADEKIGGVQKRSRENRLMERTGYGGYARGKKMTGEKKLGAGT